MQKRLINFLQKSGLKETKILLVVLTIVGGLLIFADITNEVVEGETQNFDNYLLRVLREPGNVSQPIFPEWITNVMKDITSLGSGTVIVLITLIVACYLILQKKYFIGNSGSSDVTMQWVRN